MTAFTYGTTSGVTAKDITPGLGKKVIEITVPTTFVWGTDTLAVDLDEYFGCTKISGFLAFEETTAGSVIVAATGATSVTNGTLTYDSTGSTANTCGGTVIIFGY